VREGEMNGTLVRYLPILLAIVSSTGCTQPIAPSDAGLDAATLVMDAGIDAANQPDTTVACMPGVFGTSLFGSACFQ
jgi:hypothetical protein